MTTGTYPLETMLSVLGNSHARLAAVVEPLTAAEVAGPSYDDDWSIAQVLSHLGSGAEIFGLLLDAGLRGEDAPGMEQYQEIWARWNAKSPEEPGPGRAGGRRRVPGPARGPGPGAARRAGG